MKISMFQQVHRTKQIGILPHTDVGDYEADLKWQLRSDTDLLGTFETAEEAAQRANELLGLPKDLKGWIEKPVVEFKWGE